MADAVGKSGPEKRRDVRVAARLSVHYRMEGIENLLEWYSANISYNGIFIVTTRQPPVGSEVWFDLRTAGDVVAFEGSGIVRWVRPDTGSDALPPGIGLEFTSLTGENRRRVRDLVDSFLAQVAAGVEPPRPTTRDIAGPVSSSPAALLPWTEPEKAEAGVAPGASKPVPSPPPMPAVSTPAPPTTPVSTPPSPTAPPQLAGSTAVLALLFGAALVALVLYAILRK